MRGEEERGRPGLGKSGMTRIAEEILSKRGSCSSLAFFRAIPVTRLAAQPNKDKGMFYCVLGRKTKTVTIGEREGN